jgi:hypothetical protein
MRTSPEPRYPPHPWAGHYKPLPTTNLPTSQVASLEAMLAVLWAAAYPVGDGGALPSAAGSPSAAPPSEGQITTQAAALSTLLAELPALAMPLLSHNVHFWLLALLPHPQKAIAANAALALAELAAGPGPAKTAMLLAGAVPQLVAAVSKHDKEDGSGDPVVANAARALAAIASEHAAGAAALVAAGGIALMVALLRPVKGAQVRTNAAATLLKLMAAHEAYRAAMVVEGAVAALAAAMLQVGIFSDPDCHHAGWGRTLACTISVPLGHLHPPPA